MYNPGCDDNRFLVWFLGLALFDGNFANADVDLTDEIAAAFPSPPSGSQTGYGFDTGHKAFVQKDSIQHFNSFSNSLLQIESHISEKRAHPASQCQRRGMAVHGFRHPQAWNIGFRQSPAPSS